MILCIYFFLTYFQLYNFHGWEGGQGNEWNVKWHCCSNTWESFKRQIQWHSIVYQNIAVLLLWATECHRSSEKGNHNKSWGRFRGSSENMFKVAIRGSTVKAWALRTERVLQVPWSMTHEGSDSQSRGLTHSELTAVSGRARAQVSVSPFPFFPMKFLPN